MESLLLVVDFLLVLSGDTSFVGGKASAFIHLLDQLVLTNHLKSHDTSGSLLSKYGVGLTSPVAVVSDSPVQVGVVLRMARVVERLHNPRSSAPVQVATDCFAFVQIAIPVLDFGAVVLILHAFLKDLIKDLGVGTTRVWVLNQSPCSLNELFCREMVKLSQLELLVVLA